MRSARPEVEKPDPRYANTRAALLVLTCLSEGSAAFGDTVEVHIRGAFLVVSYVSGPPGTSSSRRQDRAGTRQVVYHVVPFRDSLPNEFVLGNRHGLTAPEVLPNTVVGTEETVGVDRYGHIDTPPAQTALSLANLEKHGS
jgi:hypothetical protein